MKYYGMRGIYNRPHGFAFYGTKAALYVYLDRIRDFSGSEARTALRRSSG